MRWKIVPLYQPVCGQHQEIAHSIGRPVRLHFDFDGAQRSLERDRLAHLVRSCREERLHFFVLDRDLKDAHRLLGEAVFTGRNLRDALHDIHALRDPAEGRKLAVERRLRDDANEKLAAVAVRFIRNADG